MIIKSLLSQDFYKLTMNNVFWSQFPEVFAKYKFKCRNEDVNLLPLKAEIEDEIDQLCELRFTQDEIEWLDTFSYFSTAFVDYLETFKLHRRYVKVGEVNGKLDITVKGPITNSSMFEIFLLKIVHEVYTKNVNPVSETILAEGRQRLLEKIRAFKDFEKNEGYTPLVAEFGGRRAYTTEWHEFITRNLAENGIIIGTSDMDLARRLNIKPIGTMAHEFLQSYQGLGYHPMESQSAAFKDWLDFYGTDLSILLSDNFGDKKFLIDFTKDLAQRCFGVRHDSGPADVWGEMIISHYNALGIETRNKVLVFSDGLDFPTVFRLEKQFHGRIKTMYGIGTNLTNDFSGIVALQNVIKQVRCNGFPTAKISNNISKSICEDLDYMNYLKSCLDNI